MAQKSYRDMNIDELQEEEIRVKQLIKEKKDHRFTLHQNLKYLQRIQKEIRDYYRFQALAKIK